jgi:hypothetical protein
MKTTISLVKQLLLVIVLVSFFSCDEEVLDAFTNESGVKDPTFADSYGYLRAQKSGLPLTTENPVTYSFSLVTTAVFLDTPGSSTFSSNGGGTVYCNGSALSNLFGSYWGGSTDATRAVWNIGGNSSVPAFTDSCNTFVNVTGLDIDSWENYPKDSDINIEWIGSTDNAYVIYAELEYGGNSYGTGKYLTKKLDPGTQSVKFKASDVKAMYGSDEYPGVTFRLYAYYVDSTTQSSKKYYFINLTLITHAIYIR